MKVYMDTPEEAVSMTLAGVQLTCVGRRKDEWPDQIFCYVHREGLGHSYALRLYKSNFDAGLRFYIEAE